MEISITPLFKESITLLGAKRTMLRKESHSLTTLVVGSSHGDFGFDPRYYPGSFNLCCRSQDLKHSYSLYEKVSALAPNLKNIVVFYSIFSSGFLLEKSSSENDICPVINGLFSLELKYGDFRLDALSELARSQLSDVSIELEGRGGFLPTSGKGFFPASYGAERRASDHLKFNGIHEENIYLVKIMQLAKRMKHNLCIVVPPVRSDYRKYIGMDFSSAFRGLMEVCEQFQSDWDFSLLNCYDDAGFLDEYFGDFDHLLPDGEGAGLLTRGVNVMLRQPG
jgi:hypothetical protein